MLLNCGVRSPRQLNAFSIRPAFPDNAWSVNVTNVELQVGKVRCTSLNEKKTAITSEGQSENKICSHNPKHKTKTDFVAEQRSLYCKNRRSSKLQTTRRASDKNEHRANAMLTRPVPTRSRPYSTSNTLSLFLHPLTTVKHRNLTRISPKSPRIPFHNSSALDIAEIYPDHSMETANNEKNKRKKGTTETTTLASKHEILREGKTGRMRETDSPQQEPHQRLPNRELQSAKPLTTGLQRPQKRWKSPRRGAKSPALRDHHQILRILHSPFTPWNHLRSLSTPALSLSFAPDLWARHPGCARRAGPGPIRAPV